MGLGAGGCVGFGAGGCVGRAVGRGVAGIVSDFCAAAFVSVAFAVGSAAWVCVSAARVPAVEVESLSLCESVAVGEAVGDDVAVGGNEVAVAVGTSVGGTEVAVGGRAVAVGWGRGAVVGGIGVGVLEAQPLITNRTNKSANHFKRVRCMFDAPKKRFVQKKPDSQV